MVVFRISVKNPALHRYDKYLSKYINECLVALFLFDYKIHFITINGRIIDSQCRINLLGYIKIPLPHNHSE